MRAVVATMVLAMLWPLSATAAKVGLGDHETLYYVAPVNSTQGDGQKLYLARKYTISYFGLSYAWRDDGYVIAIQGRPQRYYAMPSHLEATEMQRRGELPQLDQDWKPSWVYWLFEGHVLQFFIGVVMTFTIIGIPVMARHVKRTRA